jgi:hypothetical protein
MTQMRDAEFLISSFPRKREPSVLRRTPLGPRFRGDDESFAEPFSRFANLQ